MPYAREDSAVIKLLWDDGSETSYKLEKHYYENLGYAVVIDDHTTVVYKDAWPMIRDKIDQMFKEMEGE